MLIAYVSVCGVCYRIVVEPMPLTSEDIMWYCDYVRIRHPFPCFGPLYHADAPRHGVRWADAIGGIVLPGEVVGWVCPD